MSAPLIPKPGAPEPDAPAPVALVTGGAKRLGAAIASALHQAGYRVLIHCRQSKSDALALASTLNSQRPDSARVLTANLDEFNDCRLLASEAEKAWHRLDVLVNNASRFYPTPMGSMTESHWQDLSGSNLRAPLWLSQALAPALAKQQGCILNLSDVHAQAPLKGHTLYCMAKAGLESLTRSLALDLAPDVRVNAIAPGAILWPEQSTESQRQRVLAQIPLGRLGQASAIADAALFLIQGTDYITGQVLAVDGGRSLAPIAGA